MSHSSEVGTVQPGQEMGPVNDQAHIGVSTANGENALPAHRVPGAASKEKGGRAGVGDAPRPEFPLLDRLAEFVPDPSNPDGGTWEPVTAGSVGAGNSTSSADNTYVIAHGWMPGYRNWADKQLNKGVLPTSWETWQGPNRAPKAEGPSTPWLYKGSRTDLKKGNFAINDTGLAESILAADPKATVLAYSWIDESATPAGFLDIPEDPFVSEAYTTMNGMRMAEALTTALAPNYDEGLGKVHLIGHSHGARRHRRRRRPAAGGRDRIPGSTSSASSPCWTRPRTTPRRSSTRSITTPRTSTGSTWRSSTSPRSRRPPAQRAAMPSERVPIRAGQAPSSWITLSRTSAPTTAASRSTTRTRESTTRACPTWST